MADENVNNPLHPEPAPASTPEPAPKRGRFWYAIRTLLRTRIVAGLLTIIPLWVTWEILEFVFRMMKSFTEPIAWELARRVQEGQKPPPALPIEGRIETELISAVIGRVLHENVPTSLPAVDREAVVDRIARKVTYLLQEVPDAPVDSEAYLHWIVPVIAVLLTLFFLYLLGLLAASVVGRRLIELFEWVFTKLPLVRTIYRSTKQIVRTMAPDSTSFQRVVLVEFPHPGMKRIAFLTSVMTDRDTGRKLASIFIPYTPYLTTGYMQLVPLEEVSETNWSVEEAIKWVMSGGIICPPTLVFDKSRPVHWADDAASDVSVSGSSSYAV